MGNETNVSSRLIIKPTMTIQEAVDSDKATPQQKAYAHIFDTNGDKEFNQREADVFNATTITCRGKDGITLWTTFADGSKGRFDMNQWYLNGGVFNLNGEVKSFSRSGAKLGADAELKNEAINKAKEMEQSGKGNLDVEMYDNGNVKEKHYSIDEKDEYVCLCYRPDGTLQYSRLIDSERDIETDYHPNGNVKGVKDRINHTYTGYNIDGTKRSFYRYDGEGHEIEGMQYYRNGNVESSVTVEKSFLGFGEDKKIEKKFYEDGTRRSYKKFEDDYVTEEKEYYKNGKIKTEITREKEKEGIVKTYYENGNLKSKKVVEWNTALRREYRKNGAYDAVAGWDEDNAKYTEYAEDSWLPNWLK